MSQLRHSTLAFVAPHHCAARRANLAQSRHNPTKTLLKPPFRSSFYRTLVAQKKPTPRRRSLHQQQHIYILATLYLYIHQSIHLYIFFVYRVALLHTYTSLVRRSVYIPHPILPVPALLPVVACCCLLLLVAADLLCCYGRLSKATSQLQPTRPLNA